MKRNTFLLTATAIGLSALVATVSLAQGPGARGYMQGQGPGMMQGQMHGEGQGPGMMQGNGYGHGHGGYGSGGCQNGGQALDAPLTVDDVRANLQKHIEWQGNDRLKVGTVIETDANTITAEIVTVDDSLVRKVQIDKNTGRHTPVK